MKTEIQYRDRYLLFVLAGLGIARIWDLMILAGYNNYKYASRKLKFLESLGLVASDYLDRHVVYFMTGKGYREIGKNHAGYKLNFSSNHDAEVARIASWVYLSQGISYMDMLTDRQMKYKLRGSNIHRPDLVVGSVAYEFERNAKQNERLKDNLKSNRKYARQVWCVPPEKKFIAERIKKFSKELMLKNVEIVMLGDINEIVLNADVSQNKLRDKPVLGERNMELVTQKTNSVVKKYF